jgi:hypothetical protein
MGASVGACKASGAIQGGELASSRQGSKKSAEGSETGGILDSLVAIKLGPECDTVVTKLELKNGPEIAEQLQCYYALCRQATGLHVTTSCFATWRKGYKTNAYGKVIPTKRTSSSSTADFERPVRVFFFDDNLELGGLGSSPGICNLRDVCTGEFVDFCPGANGFQRTTAGRHSTVLHSSQYNAILVKANILDAIEDPEYFTKIVLDYSSPGEKIMLYMDVNATVMCADSVQSKDMSASLLSTMFELMELSPKAPFDFAWGSWPPVKVQKKQTLKKLVKDITADDHGAYSSFFSEATCQSFFSQVAALADIRCSDASPPLTAEDFVSLYRDYLQTIAGSLDSNGLTQSWFRCCESLKMQHSVMLNSFGVDTRKVVLASGVDESRVMQILVNYDLWDDRDKEKYAAQFSEALVAHSASHSVPPHAILEGG